jgi:hypothetical protein
MCLFGGGWGLILGVVCGEEDFEGGGEAEDIEEMRT